MSVITLLYHSFLLNIWSLLSLWGLPVNNTSTKVMLHKKACLALWTILFGTEMNNEVIILNSHDTSEHHLGIKVILSSDCDHWYCYCYGCINLGKIEWIEGGGTEVQKAGYYIISKISFVLLTPSYMMTLDQFLRLFFLKGILHWV
jgi:hypothetical protein